LTSRAPIVREPRILVLAGPNGAGKSSVAGHALRQGGVDYFNPDEATRAALARDSSLTEPDANAWAWAQGKERLERAIEQRLSFAFETTLGGQTMTGLLLEAAHVGIPVHIWYVALDSADLHVARVKARAGQGGHAVPEAKIRARYDSSRENLVRLVPHLTELALFDNSVDGDPAQGVAPRPRRLLHLDRGQLTRIVDAAAMPSWAKPIAAAVLRIARPLPR